MANLSIRMMCPNLRCRTLLAVPSTARGKTVRCRLCGMRIQVPKQGIKKPEPVTQEAADNDS